MTSNYSLRDEIRDYWSLRAKAFDQQPGHEIFSTEEADAWRELFSQFLGAGDGRKVLDLACGTGVISHLLFDLDFNVTGIDWSDAMLAIAKEKSQKRGSSIRFLLGDAERTAEPDASYDVIVTRHLVWTLVDPEAAFAHWYRLLKPGGKLLIVDGDFVSQSVLQKLIKALNILGGYFGKESSSEQSEKMAQTHQSIISRVYFNQGAKSDAVAELLTNANFQNIRVQSDLSKINKAQSAEMGFLKSLERRNQYRYVICADKS